MSFFKPNGDGNGGSGQSSLQDLISNPRFFSHFFGTDTSNTASAVAGALQTTVVGGGVTPVTDCAADRPGQIALSAGTSAVGRSAIHSPAGVFALGGGRPLELVTGLRPTVLSNGTNRYVLIAGVIGGVSAAAQNYAAALVYDEGHVLGLSGSGANWRFWTKNNPSQEVTDTGVPVTTDFVDVVIDVNGAGTLAALSLGGVTVAQHGSHIPTGVGVIGFGIGIFRVLAGTTAQVPARVDYLGWDLS